MKSSPKFICGILLGVAAFTLTGCAVRTIPLNEGAENIKVVDASAPRYSHLTLVPVNCQYKGKILSQYEMSYAPQDTRPTQNEITLMKNKALILGANLVMINHNEIIMQGHQYEHVMLSRAYECGRQVLPLLFPILRLLFLWMIPNKINTKIFLMLNIYILEAEIPRLFAVSAGN